MKLDPYKHDLAVGLRRQLSTSKWISRPEDFVAMGWLTHVPDHPDFREQRDHIRTLIDRHEWLAAKQAMRGGGAQNLVEWRVVLSEVRPDMLLELCSPIEFAIDDVIVREWEIPKLHRHVLEELLGPWVPLDRDWARAHEADV